MTVFGSQTPRVEHVPSTGINHVRGEQVVALAELCGVTLDPWQVHYLRNSLALTEEGKYAAMTTVLLNCRQSGKSEAVVFRILAGLLLFGEKDILFSTHLYTTTETIFDRMVQLVRENTWLAKRVLGYKGDPFGKMEGIVAGYGRQRIRFNNGATVKFLARSEDTGRGMTSPTIILDEFFSVSEKALGSLMPVMSSHSMTGNPQLVLLSSAPKATSDALHKIRDSVLDGTAANSTYYAEWSAPDGAKIDDPHSWAMANPQLNYRLSEDFVRGELASMSAEEFKRERLGIPEPRLTEADMTAIDYEKWIECIDIDRIETRNKGNSPEPWAVKAFAVDVPPDMSSATITAAGWDHFGNLCVDVIDQRPGIDWVVSRLSELKKKHKPLAIVVDKGGAGKALEPDLNAYKLKTITLTGVEYTTACATVLNAINEGKFLHGDQETLNEAAEVARKKNVRAEKAWYWAKSSTEDFISPLISITYATFALNKYGDKRKLKNAGKKPEKGEAA